MTRDPSCSLGLTVVTEPLDVVCLSDVFRAAFRSMIEPLKTVRARVDTLWEQLLEPVTGNSFNEWIGVVERLVEISRSGVAVATS